VHVTNIYVQQYKKLPTVDKEEWGKSNRKLTPRSRQKATQ